MWTLDASVAHIVRIGTEFEGARTLKLFSLLKCQFARVVKGVDLRSTGVNSAWVRTPQLTSFTDCTAADVAMASRTCLDLR